MFIYLRSHFYHSEIQVYILQCYFNAVSISAVILMVGSFSKIYIYYGVFNRGTNLVSM